MKQDLENLLIKVIEESLKSLDLGNQARGCLFLDLVQDERFGQLSTNIALRLSRTTGTKPMEIAAKLSAAIRESLKNKKSGRYIKEVKAEGAGFINFYLSEEYFSDYLARLLIEGRRFFKKDTGRGKRVLIEFVSANPTGPLSVAHARQAVVGDVLANILTLLGFRVKREYYLNDEGNQINILGNSIALRLRELCGEKAEFPEDHYQGDYIYDIARQIKERSLKPGDFSQYGVGYILDIIKKELSDFGIKFDYWYSQKKLRESGKIRRTLELLRKKGLIYRQDGADWFKSTQFHDDKDRVVVKSDASYTYLAPDMAYHRDKFRRGFGWLINLWGPDHHGYINRLKAAVEALGRDRDALAVIIVQLASIYRQGKPIQMSTRRGQYITLREVLDEVGRDAARFFFIMRRTSSHLDFDLDIAKKQTSENPVYYVQYAHARISSILANAPAGLNLRKLAPVVLKEKEETQLLAKLWQFSYILKICQLTLDPYMLTVYLQELAEKFHKFYDKHRVLGQGEETTAARLALIQATKTVLAQGLELIGVSRPEKM